MPYETVRYEVDESILTITLNRPDKLNAFTTQMLHEMIDAFDRADKDDAIRAVIVTGAGRAFCAGPDLSGGGATFDRASRTDRPQSPLGPDGFSSRVSSSFSSASASSVSTTLMPLSLSVARAFSIARPSGVSTIKSPSRHRRERRTCRAVLRWLRRPAERS
jgi:hypothetical protein